MDVSPGDNIWNQPVPDLVLLRSEYLLVEISDSSLAFDMTAKAALYAMAGIAEYWVLDVVRWRLIVHRNPASGGYASVVVYEENEPVAPLAAPEAEFRASRALPA